MSSNNIGVEMEIPGSNPIPIDWNVLSPKLQKDVLAHLNYHDLLKCRLVSKSLKDHVGQVVVDVLKLDPSLNWNPYFPAAVLKSSDLSSGQLLGLIRFHSAAEVKQFLEEKNSLQQQQQQPAVPVELKTGITESSQKRPLTPHAASTEGNSHLYSHLHQIGAVKNAPTALRVTPTTVPILSAANKVPFPKRPTSPRTTTPPNTIISHTRNFQRIPPTTVRRSTNQMSYAERARLKKNPPARDPVLNSKSIPLKSQPTNSVNNNNNKFSDQSLLTLTPLLLTTTQAESADISRFPLGAVYIRRNFQEDSTALNIVSLTKSLVHDYGKYLTSFTFDDGRGLSKSNLTFEQLHSMLSQLPNLVYLGIMAANYEHHVNRDELLAPEEEVEMLPALDYLKIVSLGYNASFHLHMDILNAYGCQLKRLICSKFGYFVRSPFGNHVSTNNSLQKLLEFVNSIKSEQPFVLSSLEELKVPVISSQCLMREVDPATTSHIPATRIQWSNLKRLSLFYIHRGEEYNDCCLADIWSILNTFSASLEEFFLDFQSCSDFVEWISVDERPFTSSVFQPCENVRKLGISSVTLLRSDDMAGLIASKFPNLEVLTFFNWLAYYSEAIQQNNMQGKYFSGGPTPVTIPGHMGYYWNNLPMLQQASIRMKTLNDDCIYIRSREEMAFVPKNDVTYIY